MARLVQSCVGWVRRTLAWSNSLQSWQEGLALGGVLAGVLAAVTFARRLDLSYQVVLWGGLLVLVGALLRRGWLKLFGPVLFYDLVRTARRRRYFLIRCLYALAMLAILGWVWFVWWIGGEYRRHGHPDEITAFASSFFYTFMVVQFLVVAVLTPAYTAGAVTDEKEKKTLEFLLATDLRNREIVLSKLASRLATLGMLLLTGLPILGFLQFLGGVDPGLVLAGYTATLATMMSLAAVSILFSVVVRKSRDAVILTYLSVFAYFTLWVLTKVTPPSWLSFPSTDSWSSPLELSDLVGWYNSGNILEAVFNRLGFARRRGGPNITDVLRGVLTEYVVFHGVLVLVCATWAVLRLRAIALKESYGARKRSSLGVRLLGRPAIGKRPMVWKELFAEPGLRFHWLGKLFIVILVVASFLPVVYILGQFFAEITARQSYRTGWRGYSDPYSDLAQGMNIWVRTVGTGAACLLLVGVAVRAANSITGERARQTFDSLLTSPLDSNDILFGKWLGSVLSVRWGGLWLGAIYGLGLVTGGVNPLAFPLLVAGWLILAGFVASLGMWFSTICRANVRATASTLLALLGFWGGHWLIWACCVPLLVWGRGNVGDGLEHVAWFQAFGLTPPVTLGMLAFRLSDFEHSYRNYPLEFLLWSLFGLFLWGAAALVLYRLTSTRLRAVTGRTLFVRRSDTGFEGLLRYPKREARQRVPEDDGIVTVEEVLDGRVTPRADDAPPQPRGAVLIEEEWRDDDAKRRHN
jgi:ABC-type transport system involved in multi-copper enzyme maturation permease subunit